MSEIRVVLIEAHDLTRVGLIAALQKSKITVVGETAYGHEGLNILQKTKPDVAIVNIALPDMDGIELTQQLKELEGDINGQRTKVLILTTHDHEDSVMAAFAAGADSYSLKDVSFDNLVQAIQITNEGNSWIDPAIASVVIKQAQENSNGDSQKSQIETENTVEIDKVSIKCSSEEYQRMIEIEPLTERELEVLELIVAGCTNAQISEKLYITVGTVKTHVRSILNKLCAHDRTQAAVQALRSGLVK